MGEIVFLNPIREKIVPVFVVANAVPHTRKEMTQQNNLHKQCDKIHNEMIRMRKLKHLSEFLNRFVKREEFNQKEKTHSRNSHEIPP